LELPFNWKEDFKMARKLKRQKKQTKKEHEIEGMVKTLKGSYKSREESSCQ
jgi:hypothetical protein